MLFFVRYGRKGYGNVASLVTWAHTSFAVCVTAAGCACHAREWWCGAVVAGCGRADVADLLVAAWLTSTAAAGVLEAKKMQEM